MSNIKIFENPKFGNIRIAIQNGEPMFCLTDVCKALDIANVSMVKTRLREKGISLTDTLTNGGIQQLVYIDESNLYQCIFASKKEEAKNFRDWVCDDVLPSIRKNGMYATPDTMEKMIADPDFAIKLLITLKEERQARIEAEKKNTILMHVNKLYNTTELAKEVGFNSAILLNNFLKDKGVQFKSNNTWVLYSKYANLGYVSIKQNVLDNGTVIYDRKWTQLGREFILNLLK